MKNTCTCLLCRKGDYDPEDYRVDISSFKRERPNGVSGLMRVKNEARWVEASIESCIEALDELIICYQDCDDETPDIINRKQQEYPNKIKIYHYAPYVYAHNLSKDEFVYACSLPEDSVHLLNNYYNYTLSKASYRYALKIDADQIYFTDRLKRLCDAYRCEKPAKVTLLQRTAGLYKWGYSWLYRYYPALFYSFNTLAFFNSAKIYEKYIDYLCTQIAQTKEQVSLSGINLCYHKNKWGLLGIKREGFLCPFYFNGVGDHLIFRVSDQTYYIPAYQTPVKTEAVGKIYYNPAYEKYRIIEWFVTPDPDYYHFGFIWYHMKFATVQKVGKNQIVPVMAFQSFIASSYRRLRQLKLHTDNSFLFFLTYDKHLPVPEQFISRLKKKY